MYPSEIWCKLACIKDNKDCLFLKSCGYRKKYLRIFNRKQRGAMKRYQWYNNDVGYLPYKDLIDLSKVYLLTGFRCWYCGVVMCIGEHSTPEPNRCTIDHRISLVNGGKNEIENIVLCCHSCNQKKSGDAYP